MNTIKLPAQPAEPEFDDCAESPTGKHSASWFFNNNCEYCNTGEVRSPLYYAPSEMQIPPQEQEHVATVQCINGVTIGYLEKMLPVGTKLYIAQPAQQPLTKAQIKALIVATPEPDDGDVGKWVLSLIRAVEKAHKIGSRP